MSRTVWALMVGSLLYDEKRTFIAIKPYSFPFTRNAENGDYHTSTTSTTIRFLQTLSSSIYLILFIHKTFQSRRSSVVGICMRFVCRPPQYCTNIMFYFCSAALRFDASREGASM